MYWNTLKQYNNNETKHYNNNETCIEIIKTI